MCWGLIYYRKTSNISRTSVSNKIVDHADVVGASPVGAAPTNLYKQKGPLLVNRSPKVSSDYTPPMAGVVSDNMGDNNWHIVFYLWLSKVSVNQKKQDVIYLWLRARLQ